MLRGAATVEQGICHAPPALLCEQGYEYAIVDAEARHAAAGQRKPAAVRLRHVDWNGVFAVARRRVAAWTGSFAGIGVLPDVRSYGFRP